MKRIQVVAGMSAILFLTAGISVAAGPGHAGAQKSKAVKGPQATHGSQSPVGKALKPSKPITRPSKTADAPRALKSAKATKLAKASEPAKATKQAKATKLAKPTKPAKTTMLAKGTKPAKTTTKTAKATAKPSVTSSTAATTTLTPVQAKLQKNTNLAAKVASRLPAGTDLMTASAGFRNLGQFVAAVNVSNNLGIPFTQLKAKMVTDGLTLGQSIQALRPAASGTVEAQRAEYEARGVIAESTQPTTTTASTTTKPKPRKIYRTQVGSQD